MKFAERMSRLGTETAFEVMAKAKTLEAQGKDMIYLQIGEPDFLTPKHIIEAVLEGLKAGVRSKLVVKAVSGRFCMCL